VGTRPRPELPAARGEAAQQLAALVADRAALDRKLDAIDLAQREAGEQVVQRSAELAELERRAAGGEKVSEKARAEAERAVTGARVKAGQPWAERRQGVRAAIRDADSAIHVHVNSRWDELIGEVEEDASAAADALTRAAAQVVDAFEARMAVERRLSWLVGWVRPARVGDIAATKAEPLVREAGRFLERGGEVAPRLASDPREPRHGERPAA
jgi:hypothetical protein